MKETFIPKSTRIDEVVYDGEEQKMVITFRDGRSYEYSGVPQAVYMQMQRSPSVGSYFERQVKGRYGDTEL